MLRRHDQKYHETMYAAPRLTKSTDIDVGGPNNIVSARANQDNGMRSDWANRETYLSEQTTGRSI